MTLLFYIDNLIYFFAFNNELIMITGPDTFSCKSLNSHLLVRLGYRISYNTFVDNLFKTDTIVSIHFYLMIFIGLIIKLNLLLCT